MSIQEVDASLNKEYESAYDFIQQQIENAGTLISFVFLVCLCFCVFKGVVPQEIGYGRATEALPGRPRLNKSS